MAKLGKFDIEKARALYPELFADVYGRDKAGIIDREHDKPCGYYVARGASHNDETAQARDYDREIQNAHRANGYYVDTQVYRDGGTIRFHNPARDVATYSIGTARDWYKNNEMFYVFRDCSRTAFEICNPTRSLTRKLKGNGQVKYFRHEKGDTWR